MSSLNSSADLNVLSSFNMDFQGTFMEPAMLPPGLPLPLGSPLNQPASRESTMTFEASSGPFSTMLSEAAIMSSYLAY